VALKRRLTLESISFLLCKKYFANHMCEEQQSLLYLSLKGQIPGALEGKSAGVALGKHAVFGAAHGQLHPVTALHLEGDVVVGAVVHAAVCVMMVMMAASLGNYLSRYRQAGRGVVFEPFTHVADENGEKRGKEQNEKQSE
jgi:hypothetical protein